MQIDDRTEWIEADGLGGFSSGTASGIRTRRYHALLVPATTPPTGRVVLVNGFDAWVDTSSGPVALTTQRYVPDVLYPDGSTRLVSFSVEPWPTWEFELPDKTHLRQELLVQHGTGRVLVLWSLRGAGSVTLRVRPFLSGRDYHSIHRENGSFRFDAESAGAALRFQTYAGVPRIVFLTNADYRHAPEWYRQFLYREELERGLDAVEDLASPGELTWRLVAGGRPATWMLESDGNAPLTFVSRDQIEALAESVYSMEAARRATFVDRLDRSADAYLVRRRTGRTIVAGYPWFTDWGRDTFIALRGLCLATNRLAEARDILVEWAGAVSEGMLPNRFPDSGEEAEFNSVDASLWYVVVVHEFLERIRGQRDLLTAEQRSTLERAVRQIVTGYAAGTRFGIRMDTDGLLAAGVPGVQLTWMDARIGDFVVTPRIGKPVEIQALWLNAVAAASRLDSTWRPIFERGRASFLERFWIDDRAYLADVVDVNHELGTRDDRFRPNQILAVGGLPLALVEGERALKVLEAVEARLLTPVGLRSLDPSDPQYSPRYEGGPAARDAVYHQGTVWPWLMGPFVDAWVRARPHPETARLEARRRFLQPLLEHLDVAGLDHVSEIADAETPHRPRGCPFQAWSLGELLRLDRQVLALPRLATETALP